MLTQSAYGKSRIRLVHIARHGQRHDLRDLTVNVRFDGHYDECYRAGDNRAVLPTDTMKNTVYALAARNGFQEPEAFGLALTAHFLARNPRLQTVQVSLTDHPWGRINVGDRGHDHAFVRNGPDSRTALVTAGRERVQVEAGVSDLVILKSASSAFSGYLRDEFTTLRETRDRLLATSLAASWRYRDADVRFGSAWHAVRRALLEAFAEHDSESVQHTMHAMGQAVLDAVDEVASIHLVMPNKHHLPVDLSPFGMENRNEIFVATEEPHGLIEATLAREGS